MRSVLSPFEFDLGNLNPDPRQDFIARIPAGLASREALFEALSPALALPDYFGRNWDALSDCLRDLSWIKHRRVLILHEDVPMQRQDERSTYLDVLADAVRDWKRDEDHELIVGFPETARRTVEEIVRR